MSTNRIILNETSYFVAGSRNVIPQEIKGRGFKKALVISDKDLVKFGVVKMVTDILDKESIPYAIYEDVKQNPTVTNVKGGVEAFKAAGADFIIAIGGGSSIDTSKGVGMIMAVAKDDADKALALIAEAGQQAYIIGECKEGEKGITLR